MTAVVAIISAFKPIQADIQRISLERNFCIHFQSAIGEKVDFLHIYVNQISSLFDYKVQQFDHWIVDFQFG